MMSTARRRPLVAEIETRSAPVSVAAPAASSFSNTSPKCCGTTPITVAEPPVMAAAIKSVAASMRSGINRCVAPPS